MVITEHQIIRINVLLFLCLYCIVNISESAITVKNRLSNNMTKFMQKTYGLCVVHYC
jgi:hypothetical protein